MPFLFLMMLVFSAYAAAHSESSDTERKDYSSPESRRLSVLLVAPPYSGHVIPFLALAEELVGRGHNVTLVSGATDFVLKEAKRLRVNLWSISDGFVSPEELIEQAKEVSKKGAIPTVNHLVNSSVRFQEALLKTIDNPAVESFDIIAGDASFTMSLVCFSQKWNVPAVNVWLSLVAFPFDLYPWPFPCFLSGYTDDLTFFQRLHSTVSTQVLALVTRYTAPGTFKFAEGVCGHVNISVSQLLTFIHYLPQIVTTSFGFEFPRVLLPLTEYVGPIISRSPSPLTPDLAEWLGRREPGSVVYVSMGSTAILTAGEAESIVGGASRANLSVVWSLRRSNQHVLERLTFDPESVLVVDWAPQLALLRHPSIHSAVLHGGMGGVQEALSCGIPIIVVPFFGDQLENAARVQHHHYGKMIHRHQLTSDLISRTLRLFDSEVYRRSLWGIQRIYRADGGASRAAELLEFYSEVGYQHLVPSYAKYNWSWVEFYNVDVYSLLALAVLLPSYLVCRLIRRCVCGTSSKSKKKTE